MTNFELHKELLRDDSNLPVRRRQLGEGMLIIPQVGAFDIRHQGKEVIVTGLKQESRLAEGDSAVIATDMSARWRVFHIKEELR